MRLVTSRIRKKYERATRMNIKIEAAGGIKCPRCWKQHHVVDNFDGLCDGCQDVLIRFYPEHPSTRRIYEALAKQREKYEPRRR